MSEIKPINWDSLPKVWAWDDGKIEEVSHGVYLFENKLREYNVLLESSIVHSFDNISETDPRIKMPKMPKMRVMTAEELNDIYWEFGKDFRYRINSLAPIFGFYNYSLDTKIESNEQYSTDRGKTWNKCEVAE